MNEFKELLGLLEQFRDERDWGQFHDSKNLALALSIEAAELNELFLWKKDAEAEEVDREKLREELADVFAYAIMLAGRHGLEVSEIVKSIEQLSERIDNIGSGASTTIAKSETSVNVPSTQDLANMGWDEVHTLAQRTLRGA